MTTRFDDKFLTDLIDDLRPLNNSFRHTNDALEKIKIMWDLGERIARALNDSGAKLHELLYTLYDPYSSNKASFITRDLCSYSYRIYEHFKDRATIEEKLSGLKNYSLFREAIPLLFNKKYKLTDSEKEEILKIIKSSKPTGGVITYLKNRKQSILPVKNPRNQRAKEFEEEAGRLYQVKSETIKLYKENDTLPDLKGFTYRSTDLDSLINIIMTLANDSYQSKVDDIDRNSLPESVKLLFDVAHGSTQDKARFRKWAMSSSELLGLAELLNGLKSDTTYRLVKSKVNRQES